MQHSHDYKMGHAGYFAGVPFKYYEGNAEQELGWKDAQEKHQSDITLEGLIWR